MNRGIYSAIDANINRSLEGLRVCEDVFRFVISNERIALQFKSVRHDIVRAISVFSEVNLLHGRDVNADSLKFSDLKSEQERESIRDILKRNIHRAIEGMRSVEEFYKLSNQGAVSCPFQKIRFLLYSLEKEALSFMNRESRVKIFRDSLYAILDSSFVRDNDYTGIAERLINGGASIVQLRMKHAASGEVLSVAKEVSYLCREKGVLFIVNDSPEIAVLSGADGVHLGQEDMPIEDARRILQFHMIVGISTHSFTQAKQACEFFPDYIAIGPVYDTESKDGKLQKGIGLEVVRNSVAAVNMPVIAIGGITPKKSVELRKAGCGCSAVLSFLYTDDRIEENCRAFNTALPF